MTAAKEEAWSICVTIEVRARDLREGHQPIA